MFAHFDGVVKELSLAEFSSPEFDQFLDLLGDKIDLLGWEQFKGGLDTKSRPLRIFEIDYEYFIRLDNSTGKQSLYTVFQGHEIMFHVSTMLPYHVENKQQVEYCCMVTIDHNEYVFYPGKTTNDVLFLVFYLTWHWNQYVFVSVGVCVW